MSNELIAVEEKNVLAAFSSEDGLDSIINQAKDFVGNFEHDLSTQAGRKRTASLSAKVASLKVKLDGMGKDSVADLKAKSKAVDANRKSMRDELDALKVIARKPLTEWEAEQAEIKAKEEAERLEAERKAEVDRDHELGDLMNAEYDRKAEEARKEAAEAERLRLETEAKEKAERDERLKKEAAEQARLETERKAKEEQDRIQAAKEKAEREKVEAQEREEQAKRDKIAAEERVKLQAEQAEKNRIAAEEKSKVDAENARIKAEQDAKQAAEDARQAEIKRQQDEQDRIAREQAQREANNRHVGSVRKSAKEDLMQINGVTEDIAKAIVLKINAGEVRNIAISY